MSPWVIIYRSAWGLLALLVMIGLLCIFLPKCHEIRELQRNREKLQEENRNTDRATKALRLKRERFDSEPAFVEQVAREAGMLRRDEVMFKFTNESRPNAEQVTP